MVKYYLDGKLSSHDSVMSEILSVYPSIRHIRKMTMLDWVEMKADEGDARAAALLGRILRVDISHEVRKAFENNFYSTEDLKEGNTFLRDFCDSTGCPYNEDTEKAVLKVFSQIIKEYNL